MTDETLRVLIPSEKIQARIRELGEQISGDYPDGNLHLICILKGAVFFLTDLARAMCSSILARRSGEYSRRYICRPRRQVRTKAGPIAAGHPGSR